MKVKFYLILFLSVFYLTLSCKNDKDSESKNNLTTKKLNLDVQPKNISGEFVHDTKLLSPGKMVIKDSIVYIEDYKAEKFIHAIDWKNKAYISSFAKKGQGPGELLSVSSIDLFESRLWLNDITLSKLVGFDVDSTIPSDLSKPIEINYKERARQNYNSGWLNDSVLVSTTFSESKNRLMFTNREGKIFSEKFEMIEPVDPKVPSTINNMSYQGALQIRPDKSRIVIVNRYSDLLEIYNLENNNFIRVKTHSDFPPIYEVVNSDGDYRMQQDGTTKFGYIDVSVTNDKIFALFSGKKREEGMGNFGKVIVVFNWSGEFLESYQIPNFSRTLTAIDNTNLLVVELVENIPTLKKYVLNEK